MSSEDRAAAATAATALLTIAIPTYNRAEKLAKLLAQIADEIGGVRDRVNVAVSNNASTDATSEFLAGYVLDHPEMMIDVYTQSENIGPVPNVHYLVARARGEWVWCVGDDDLFVPGAIARLLKVLESYSGGDVLLARASGIREWDKIPAWIAPADVRPVSVRSAEGASHLFAASFLASTILRAQAWRRVIPAAEAFHAPNYLTWVAVLLLASERAVIGVVDQPCVRGNATMTGEMRFAQYAVLVDQRLRVVSDLADDKLRHFLRPIAAHLFAVGWMGVAGALSELHTFEEKTRAFARGAKLIGWRAIRALPWFLLALLLPAEIRRRMVVWRRRAAVAERA